MIFAKKTQEKIKETPKGLFFLAEKLVINKLFLDSVIDVFYFDINNILFRVRRVISYTLLPQAHISHFHTKCEHWKCLK